MKQFFQGTAAIVGLGAIILSIQTASAATGDGIYADFTTSMGNFSCALDFTNAPRTTANFIGLATGARPWLDLPTGLMRTNPFYDGLIFHRVVKGFISQAGSPNGTGSDGPGYLLRDEISPKLRHNGFGVLAMANSGPDSNGSQFYLTDSVQPKLDDNYTVFGRLVSGSNVLYSINRVATNANSLPLTNVVIQRVAIRRQGATATAFDIHAQGLPWVTNPPVTLLLTPTNAFLQFTNKLAVDNKIYFSSNLLQWSSAAVGIETEDPVSKGLIVNASFPMRFYRMAQVYYPPPVFVPSNVRNRTMTLNLTNGLTFQINFDGAAGGSFSASTGLASNIVTYSWSQGVYRGRFTPLVMNGVAPLVMELDYTNASSGNLSGAAYPLYPFTIGASPIGGGFNSSP